MSQSQGEFRVLGVFFFAVAGVIVDDPLGDDYLTEWHFPEAKGSSTAGRKTSTSHGAIQSPPFLKLLFGYTCPRGY